MRLLFIITALILSTLFTFGQRYQKEGDAFFEEGNFKEALSKYLKAYEKDAASVDLRHNIAICYLNLNLDRSAAIPHLQWIVKQDKFETYAWYDLARAYHYDQQFDKAIKFYQKYLNQGKDGNLLGFGGIDEEFVKLTKLGIKQCKNAKKLVKQPINVSFFNLGEDINTEFNEFQPYIPADESTLVFTSDEKYDSRYKIHINNIYIAEKDGTNWDRPKRVGVVNSTEDEFVSGLAANDQYLFVKYQRYEAFDDIFWAEKDGDRISRPENMGPTINTGAVESGATLSYSGDTLIFASDREGGEGGLDLWMALRLPNGKWGKPQNMGKPLNTPYDEDFPHLMPDGKTLFFSSTGHTSMGGYDIFKSKLNEQDGRWKKPENIGYPVNNTYDNYSIAMAKNYRYAYVSDIREEGYGGMDIYRVVFQKVAGNVFLHRCTLTDKEGNVLGLDEEAAPEIKVFNRQTNKLFGKYKYNADSKEILMALPPGKYNVKIDMNGYQKTTKRIDVPDILQKKVFKHEIVFQRK